MQIINRNLNANIFDTGKRNKGKMVKGITLSNGLNYRDKSTGIIMPVDTTVFEQTDYEFTHKVDKCRATLRFGDNSSNAKKHLFGIEDDAGNWLNVKLNINGHNLSGIIGNKPTFPDADGLTVEHIPKYNGIKTNYRLGSSGINEITVTFKYNNEIIPEQRGNAIVFIRDGKDIFHIKSPYAFDGDESNGIEPVMMVLGETSGFASATLTVDSEWLATAIDPIIDPDVTIEDGVDGGIIGDTFIQGYLPNNPHGTETVLILGTTDPMSIVLDVDLSAYEELNIISSVFKLYCYSDVGAVTANWYRLKRQFVESQASWNNYATGNPWDTAGAKGAEDREATPQNDTPLELPSVGWHTFDCKPESVALDLGGKFSIVVEDTAPSGNIRKSYHSTENAASEKPQFYMEYEFPANGTHFFFYNATSWF